MYTTPAAIANRYIGLYILVVCATLYTALWIRIKVFAVGGQSQGLFY